MQYIYILICSDKSSYIGCTENLKERIERHTNGYAPATKDRRPVKLISYFAFSSKYTAFNFKNYLKSGSGWHSYYLTRAQQEISNLKKHFLLQPLNISVALQSQD